MIPDFEIIIFLKQRRYPNSWCCMVYVGPSRWKVGGPQPQPSRFDLRGMLHSAFGLRGAAAQTASSHAALCRALEPEREGAAAEVETTVLFVPGPGEGVWSLRSGKNAKKTQILVDVC